MNEGGKPNSGGQSQSNPNANEWDSLYTGIRDNIEQNFQDDQDYIDSKRKKIPIEYSEEDAARDRAEREALRDEQLGQIDALQAKLEQTQNRDEAEYNKQHWEDFAGERAFNDKKNKARTFVDKDIYPDINPTPGQTFGERTRRRNDFTVLTEYIPMFQDEKSEEYSKRIDLVYQDFPRQEDETLEQYKERIAAADENGDLLSSLVSHTVDQDSKAGRQLRDDLANIEDMHFDEDRAKQLRREVMQTALENQRAQEQEQARAARRAELKERLRQKHEGQSAEDIEKAKLAAVELEKAREAAAEKAKLAAAACREAAAEVRQQHQDEIDAILEKMSNPQQAAINFDVSRDRQELAHDYAEMALNAEKATQGFVKNLWKGNLFRKYYEKKYEREILEGRREVELEDGTKKNLDQIVRERSESAIARFTYAAIEGYEKSDFIHRKAGEEMRESDKETSLAISSVIKQYVNDWAKNNSDPHSLRDNNDIRREFDNSIREALAQLRDSSQAEHGTLDNYYDVATDTLARARVITQASEKITHEMAIDRVMDGFKVYNADVRNNVRTEAHRDNIDKIVNRLESSALGSIIPPEIIAAAVGTASALTQTGVRAATGVAGALGLSGLFAGLRERNRVTEDRARMMRDKAVGLEYDSGYANRAARKRAKYEARLGGTLYDVRPANELAANIDQALDSGDEDAVLRAIAEARVRVDFSDSERKDLISYSSAEELGDERAWLDVSLVRAEKRFSRNADNRQKLEAMKAEIQKQITQSVREQDRDFRRFRTAQAVKQSGKTIAIGAAFFLGSQEVMAAMDPNKIGILEKAGILKTQNSDTASETILAHLAPNNASANTTYTTEPINVRGDQEAKIKELEEAGYTGREVTPAHHETSRDIQDVLPANSTHALKVNTTFADNGTLAADGNELNLYLENGRYVANLHGNSSLGNQVFNYEQLANAGRIKGHISIGGGTFEVASSIDPSGQITWPIDASGNITTTTGETIRAFGENGEKLFKAFRVVADNGTDANGIQQVVSLAADRGADTFSGTIKQIVETTIEQPAVYEFTKTIANAGATSGGLTLEGVMVPPFASRAGLGRARARRTERPSQQSTESVPEPEATSPAPVENQPPQAPAPQAAAPAASTGNQPAPVAENQSAANTASSAPETAPQAPVPEFGVTAAIRATFQDAVGETGVRYMIDDAAYDPENRLLQDQMASWWSSLDEAAQRDVIEYERNNSSAPQGRALRAWLSMQRVL
ncbi:hypothetical protein IJG22_01520 [Candidatus Saccharibacteria bacterium]|nr:hypothetical protein [Candidatus Saccharibacteria bacterium]